MSAPAGRRPSASDATSPDRPGEWTGLGHHTPLPTRLARLPVASHRLARRRRKSGWHCGCHKAELEGETGLTCWLLAHLLTRLLGLGGVEPRSEEMVGALG